MMAQTLTLTFSGLALGFLGFYLVNNAKSKQESSSLLFPFSGTDDPLVKSVKSLPDFEYTKVRPVAYRPFLTSTQLAMGVSKCFKEDWIQIDLNYLDRILERKGNLAAHPEAISMNDGCAPAVEEVFVQVIENILIRYPTIFRLEGNTLQNHVTGAEYDLGKVLKEPLKMLQVLSENVEEDLYLMCPDSDGVFFLQGFVSCFTNGFSSLGKLGQSMRDIHEPVPALNASIGSRVDRFMTGLQAGSVVQRFGWSLQFNGRDLLRTGGSNFYSLAGEDAHDVPEDQDLSQCYLRVERQTLVRLEKSKAILFGIRQYMTHIEEIKKEGNGPALADAITSLPESLGHYKMRPVWQRDVDSYLRS